MPPIPNDVKSIVLEKITSAALDVSESSGMWSVTRASQHFHSRGK